MSTFRFCTVEHQLEVLDKASTTFRSEHTFGIEAIIPSRFFVRDFLWTGSGTEKEPVPEVVSEIDSWGFPKHRIHGPLIVEGEARTLVIDLGRTINVGEAEAVCFRHQMKDLGRTFRPVLWVRPSSEIRDWLRLRVILPDWRGLSVMYHRFTHDNAKVVESERITPVISHNGRLLFEREISNPSAEKMGHRLEWRHDEQ